VDNLLDAIARAKSERRGALGKLPDKPRRWSKSEGEGKSSSRSAQDARDMQERSLRDIHPEIRIVDVNQDVLERNRIIAPRINDVRVEPYRQLRTRVLHAMQSNQWQTLAITSPLENAGKTLTAINLSIILSHEVGLSVLLVDLDFRNPCIHERFGVSVEQGIADVLDGTAKLEDVVFSPGEPNLVILPGRPLGKYSSELLTSPGMQQLLDQMTDLFSPNHLIIFELPPLTRNDDALKFAPLADATLLVVESGGNSKDVVAQSLRMLDQANLIGTVLNKAV
jgi:capsular exopolysaccharide synthesis family protein